LVIIPPTINKFYILDLAPGRSMVEYLVSRGQQVFVVSWRNPDARHSKWGAGTYCQAILDAIDTACDIAGADTAQLMGTCSGGILSSMAVAHLAQIGKPHRIAGFTLLVTLLDQAAAGTIGVVADETTAEAAITASRARGYLDGRALAEVFAWLRPNDLIWNYWVNNYLQGKRPPAFDILFWNADTTRMTAALHHDFVRMAIGNALAHPGGATVLGTEVDLTAVNVDSYIVAGSADHICPWQSCYRSTQLLGGTSRFVLSTNGHIAALVNPPTNPKSSYQTTADGAENPSDPQAWLDAAKTEHGSWWHRRGQHLVDQPGAGEALECPGLNRGGAGLAMRYRQALQNPGHHTMARQLGRGEQTRRACADDHHVGFGPVRGERSHESTPDCAPDRSPLSPGHPPPPADRSLRPTAEQRRSRVQVSPCGNGAAPRGSGLVISWIGLPRSQHRPIRGTSRSSLVTTSVSPSW
jgi:poly(3-hydroxyalkanoate) synthetase